MKKSLLVLTTLPLLLFSCGNQEPSSSSVVSSTPQDSTSSGDSTSSQSVTTSEVTSSPTESSSTNLTLASRSAAITAVMATVDCFESTESLSGTYTQTGSILDYSIDIDVSIRASHRGSVRRGIYNGESSTTVSSSIGTGSGINQSTTSYVFDDEGVTYSAAISKMGENETKTYSVSQEDTATYIRSNILLTPVDVIDQMNTLIGGTDTGTIEYDFSGSVLDLIITASGSGYTLGDTGINADFDFTFAYVYRNGYLSSVVRTVGPLTGVATYEYPSSLTDLDVPDLTDGTWTEVGSILQNE